jgi:hypothetical protein
MDAAAELEFHVALGEVISDRTGIGHRAGEPVKFWYYQRVAAADGCECLVEAGPGAVGSGETVISIDPV